MSEPEKGLALLIRSKQPHDKASQQITQEEDMLNSTFSRLGGRLSRSAGKDQLSAWLNKFSD